MASQITHVPYGKKVLDLYLRDQIKDERKYFIGTLFPDIRYLGVIDRASTHVNAPSNDELKNIEGDFQLGMYAHSLVDYERERVLEKMGIYSLVDKTKPLIYAMKFIEDEITFDLISDWDKYIVYLDEVLEEEIELVPADSARQWHGLLRSFFQRPNWETVTNFALGLKGFTREVLEAVKVEEGKIRDDIKAMELIRGTYEAMFENNSS
ncbi:hypothetical protein HY333_00230 [Candidatus Collierbacteria bacterium]|nr:hypothetical protein [Candidatus Collierbacteria bacterium]